MDGPVDPFTSHLQVRKRDWVYAVVGSVLLLPWRAVAIVAILLLAWLLAKIGLMGQNPEAQTVVKGWRRHLLNIYSYLGLAILWVAGFSVTMKGRQATRAEAPILVGAPHSSFLEALVIIMCRCSPVSRSENRDAIVISECQKFIRTIFVDRSSQASRKEASQAIIDRSRHEDDGQLQVFIFPEGTNTNRKALIQFKNGAFNPGTPVQPVLVRYPGYEDLDLITWTFRQDHSYLFSVWFLLVRPINRIEIEFLPVYKPSDEEKRDPSLFAKNVQAVMASQLNIIPTNLVFHKYYEEYCRKYRPGVILTQDKKDQ